MFQPGDLECPWLSLLLFANDDPLSPIKSYGMGRPERIEGDGTWANFTSVIDIVEDIPEEAYQAAVMIRIPPRVYENLLLDDFEMKHLGSYGELSR